MAYDVRGSRDDRGQEDRDKKVFVNQ